MPLQLIVQTGVEKTFQIIDAGGGASTLVDDLLERGFGHMTVFDIYSASTNAARIQFGSREKEVTWIDPDDTKVALSYHYYDLWHDCAAFHFLTSSKNLKRYLEPVKHSLEPMGMSLSLLSL